MKGKFFLLIFLIITVSCATSRPLGRVRVIHYTEDFREKKSLGELKVKKCQYSVGKYAGGQSLSSEAAYQELIEKKGGLSYLENLSFSTDDFGISGLGGKKCIVVKGVGYR